MQLNNILLHLLFQEEPHNMDFRSELIKPTFLLHRDLVTVLLVVVIISGFV
jgi:hypothetical protein